MWIKTHSHVLAAKKSVWHASVLFTGTVTSPFSAPFISVTTYQFLLIYILSPPYTYMTMHTKFEGNKSSSSQDTVCVPKNCLTFFAFF